MRRLLSILAGALVLPLAACGDDGPTEPTIEASGTYQLATVNGQDLPVTIQQAGADFIEVLDGTIALRSDNTFSDSTTFRVSEAGEETTEVEVLSGSYAQSRNVLTLSPEAGGSYALSVSEDALTQTVGQFVLVYRK